MAEAKLILRFGILFSWSGSAAVNGACKATSPLANDKYLVVLLFVRDIVFFRRSILCSV